MNHVNFCNKALPQDTGSNVAVTQDTVFLPIVDDIQREIFFLVEDLEYQFRSELLFSESLS